MTAGACRRRDERCCDRRGERLSHGRGPEGRAPESRARARASVAGGANASVTKGVAQELPEGASTSGSAGGDGKRDRRGRPLV